MHIASFDVGQKHLACVVVETYTRTILHWQKDELPGLSARDVCAYVRSLPLTQHAELVVLIEQQPAIWKAASRTWLTNPKILKLEGMLQGAFAMVGATVVSRATSHKTAYLRASEPLLKRAYKDRKYMSTAVVRDVILPRHSEPAAQSLAAFMAEPTNKKDDLSDALLQV